MTDKKYIKLNKSILLEYNYISDNNVSENYSVSTNLQDGSRNFISSTSTYLNNEYNTFFTVDNVLKKYAKINYNNYNFIKNQTYFTQFVPYDKLKIYFPDNYNFNNNTYKGFTLRVYTLDYNNNVKYYFTNFIFDNEDPTCDKYFKFIQTFRYDSISWSKYIEIDIPSIDSVAKQRVNNVTVDNSINRNLTENGIGISQTSPIFVEFSFITSNSIVFDTKYFFGGDIYKTSITKTPEYQNLTVQIVENNDINVFEIYGTYGSGNLDEFINELTAKGRKIEINYIITTYQENLITNIETRVVKENFSKKELFRPILLNTNTTSVIDVQMEIIDLVDNSKIIKNTSVGLRETILKYGANLQRINVADISKPKLYVQKNVNTNVNNIGSNVTNININKVYYPLLINSFKILVGSSNSTNSELKGMGLLKIMLSPFDNVLKFSIYKQTNNNAYPYDLSTIINNSTITISFKSDDNYVEKNMYVESNTIDLKNGIVVFKLDEIDINTIKKIAKDNKKFFINLKTLNDNSRTLLYMGEFTLINDVKFVDVVNSGSVNSGSATNTNNTNLNLPVSVNNEIITTTTANINRYDINLYTNVMVVLKVEADVNSFETYLTSIAASVYVKGNLVYFISVLNKNKLTGLRQNTNVLKVVEIPFDFGKSVAESLVKAQKLRDSLNNLSSNTSTNNTTNTSNA